MSDNTIMDAKDFKIEALEKAILERDKEIQILNKRIEDVKYWTTLCMDLLRKDIENKKAIILKGIANEIERPVLQYHKQNEKANNGE